MIPKRLHHKKTRKILPNLSLKPSLNYMFSYRILGFVTSLPMLLRYEDRNSMIHSLESRVPFLTPKLVDFVSSLPTSYIVSDAGETKHVFHQAMREIVSDSILDRVDIIGFQTDEGRWFKHESDKVDSMFASETMREIPFIDDSRLLAQWKSQGNGDGGSLPVWRLFNLARWIELFEVKIERS